MDINEYLREEIKKAMPSKVKNISALAELAKINQPNLSEFMKKRRGLQLETAWKIMQILGLQITNPIDFVEGESVFKVSVIGIAGAGTEYNNDNPQELEKIDIPAKYKLADLKAIKVVGDSMSPTIEDGAYVGVVPFSGTIQENKIYAVNREPFGLMVKRVFFNTDGQIVLRSDNPRHEDKTIPYEGYDTLIIGRVVWVWQNL